MQSIAPGHELARKARRVLLGWLAACLVAILPGLVAVVAIAGPPRDLSDVIFLLTFAPALALAVSAPGLLLAIITERMGARRPRWYVLAGLGSAGLAAIAAFWLAPTEHIHKFSTDAVPLAQRIEVATMLFALAAPIGALAGYVYWRIAVRARESR